MSPHSSKISVAFPSVYPEARLQQFEGHLIEPDFQMFAIGYELLVMSFQGHLIKIIIESMGKFIFSQEKCFWSKRTGIIYNSSNFVFFFFFLLGKRL